MKLLGLWMVFATALGACSGGLSGVGTGGSAGEGGGGGASTGAEGGHGGTAGGGMAGHAGAAGSAAGGTAGNGGAGGRGGTPTCTERRVPPLASEPIAQTPGRPKWDLPVFVAQAPGAAELYVVEQTGRIWPVQNDVSLDAPFLDLSDVVSSGFELGLLGLAFHPDYNRAGDPDNGRFFVFYTENDEVGWRDVVAEYRRSAEDPLVADATEVQRLIDIYDRYENHNGGMLAFDDDGYLYVGIGDEGRGGDPHDNGQNLSTLFGAILRLDVDAPSNDFAAAGNPFSASTTPAGDPRIWHYGLRNPWRFSFDRSTGDMYIGDVGQHAWEEIDFVSPGTSANFGWSAYEGHDAYKDQNAPTPVTFPIRAVSHSSDPILGSGNSVTGGYVYRGNNIQGLEGFYVYADFINGNVGAFQYADGQVCNDQFVQPLSSPGVSSFGEDGDGELYIMYLNAGEVHRIVLAP